MTSLGDSNRSYVRKNENRGKCRPSRLDRVNIFVFGHAGASTVCSLDSTHFTGLNQWMLLLYTVTLISCIKIKINLNFCGALKGFMKTFKAFIEPFEARQRSVKIKSYVNFLFLSGVGTGTVNVDFYMLKHIS